MALSLCEAKYVATSHVAYQTLWMGMLLEELKITKVVHIKLLVDNKSIIDLANHTMRNGRSKHMVRKHHLLRDQLNKNKLKVKY